jgi:hypothetical protein
MFRIPNFHEMTEMTWDEAVRIIKGRGKGDLLAGMEEMNGVWDRYIADQNAFYNGEKDEMIYGDDDDFFEHWCYECNAYNIVFEGMGKLFGEVK